MIFMQHVTYGGIVPDEYLLTMEIGGRFLCTHANIDALASFLFDFTPWDRRTHKP